MSKWQDISTAPKDGRGILVIDMGALVPEAGPAWWKADVWTLVCPGGGIALDHEVYRALTWPTPTHWMPLPAAPDTPTPSVMEEKQEPVPDQPAGEVVGEREAIARCLQIVREVRDGFLSEQYAVGQPLASFSERFACDQVARAIENEFAHPTGSRTDG